MRYKFLQSILLIIFVCAVAVSLASAQQREFDINVSLKGSTLGTAGSSVPVRVKITNRASDDLKTEDLSAGILFKFSKCRKTEICTARKQVYVGGADIKPKILKKGESFSFVVNLAGLNWNDANAQVLDFTNAVTMVTIPENEYLFFAEIRIFEKANVPPPSVTSAPKPQASYRSFFSNEIPVKINPKGF